MDRNGNHTDYLTLLERILCFAAIAWLLMVGIISNTVLHHILHALPIAVLLLVKRTRAVRLTAALVGFIWVFMLSAITPMVYDSLVRGFLFTSDNPDMWLAPVMSLLAGLWASLNLAVLRPRRVGWFIPGGFLITPALALLYPLVNSLFKIPVEHVIHGQPVWAILLAVELTAVLLGPWALFVHITGSRELKCGKRLVFWQILFWLFFLACMVIGLMPALNPSSSAPLKPVAGLNTEWYLQNKSADCTIDKGDRTLASIYNNSAGFPPGGSLIHGKRSPAA